MPDTEEMIAEGQIMDEEEAIERAERKKLVGYCEKCEVWTKFTRGTDKEECGCGNHFSSVIGHQITTQRTWNPKKK